MRDVHPAVDPLLAEGRGVFLLRDHPGMRGIVGRLKARGELTSVLPGVFLPSAADSWQMRALAACRWDCDAVLTGEAAAAVSFWPELAPAVIRVANCRAQFVRRGFQFSRRAIPDELIRHSGSLRYTDPALTALDLVETHGGDAIDRVLRSRTASLAGMRTALALTASRRGNTERRRVLLDSRDEPWSEAERLAHRILRADGLDGWRTNLEVRCGTKTYFLDIAFRHAKVAIEIDGVIHQRLDLFESDRARNNDLVLAGWTVLHFTWRMLVEDPDACIAAIRRALRVGTRLSA